jgi:hypothetical protein
LITTTLGRICGDHFASARRSRLMAPNLGFVLAPAQCVQHQWLRRVCNSVSAGHQRLTSCLTQRAAHAGDAPPPEAHHAQATPVPAVPLRRITPVLVARPRTVQADTLSLTAALAHPQIAVLLPASHSVVRERLGR